MKVSVLTSNVSGNCFGRAWLLAQLLKDDYDMEIIGPAYGDGIWKPMSDLCDFDIKIVRGFPNGQFEFKRMLDLISGDVVYASKPLMASYGVGLAKRIISKKPLFLDIDDWEPGFGKDFYDSLPWFKKINDIRLSVFNLRSYYYTVILDKFIRFADKVTVSGKVLQSKYGGTIIWHSRKIKAVNPTNFERRSLRKKLFKVGDDTFIMGFVGTPRPHKGLEEIIEAMRFFIQKKMIFVIIGATNNEYCKKIKIQANRSYLTNKIILLPPQNFDKNPLLLSLIDLVVIPQTKTSASFGQVPAKIFDAMAMGKPIIASDIYDISDILKECAILVEPGNKEKLITAIQYCYDHPYETSLLGEKALKKFDNEYSWAISKKKLKSVFNNKK